MTTDLRSAASSNAKEYLSAWAASACDVLGKITGTAFSATDLPVEEVSGQLVTLKEAGVWVRFKVGKALGGEQAFGVCKSDALHLAQTLVGEPPDDTPEFSSEHQDALGELFRQFAGTAALALKPQVGGEVSLELAGYGPAGWTPGLTWGVRIKNEASLQFTLLVLLDSALGGSLAAVSGGGSAQPPPPPVQPPAASAEVPQSSRNINLLLDIELKVSLRFGKREMLLRDILDLSAGAVVELDQKILDPVDLLVGRKVVARGEVVVMDGHYALRVTEVLNPLERIESLRS